jgi:NADH dehydrogenase
MAAASRPVLVTGATGYLGRRVVPQLLAAGHELRALVRDPARAAVPAGVDLVRGDLGDGGALAAACRGAGAVVSLAAVTADRKAPAGGYDAVNARGVGALARTAADAGVDRIVHLGGIDTSQGEPGPYLAGRRAGERAIRESGVPWALLQPSIMFGGPDSAFVRAMVGLIRRAPVVPVPGDGRLLLQPVWVEDVARCVAALAVGDVPTGQAYPIGGADRLSYDQVLDAIGAAIGRSHVRKLHVPVSLARAQAAALQLLPHPPVTPAALELFAADNVAEPNQIGPVFGIAPRGLREHLREHGVDG